MGVYCSDDSSTIGHLPPKCVCFSQPNEEQKQASKYEAFPKEPDLPPPEAAAARVDAWMRPVRPAAPNNYFLGGRLPRYSPPMATACPSTTVPSRSIALITCAGPVTSEAARRAALEAKNMPATSAIPAVPSLARWKALRDQAQAFLQTMHEEMEAYWEERSEQWQESVEGRGVPGDHRPSGRRQNRRRRDRH